MKGAGLPATHFQGLLDDIALRVRTASVEAYRHRRKEAQERCRKAQAWGDDEYVALALALDAAIWTLDADFARVEGVQVVGTGEVDGA